MEPNISTLPLMQMASGDILSLQIYEFTGAVSGKTAYIQANLHGAELAGNAVIHQFMEWLRSRAPQQLAGTLRIVPVCNPLGVNARAHNFASGRYNPYSGRDYNRIFWDYETVAEDIPGFAAAHRNSSPTEIVHAYRQQILAAFEAEQAALNAAPHVPAHKLYRTQLQRLALGADYVIDLHSSSNQGLTYLYYMDRRAEEAQLFGLDFAILLDCYDGDAFDEAFLKPWLALEDAFAHHGRSLRLDVEAFTLELGGGMTLDPQSVERGLLGLQRYLTQKGVLQGMAVTTPSQPSPLTRASQVTKFYAPTGGLVQHRVEPGSWVKEGDRLYQLLCFNKMGKIPQMQPVESDRSGLVFDVSINHAVNQGEYVLTLMQPDTDDPQAVRT